VGNPPVGLHMRPAMAIAKLARGLRCTVTVIFGEKKADGRSPTDLLMLLAPPGSELTLEVDGEDADLIVQPLVDILTAEGEGDNSATNS
jgi:phosphotransferase system HPr (HPr) family protein